MSLLESPITLEFWQKELGGRGTLYEEFRAVDEQRGVQSHRDLDGVVVLGDPPGIRTRGRRCLDGEDIVIIQTKAKRLGPHLFGQALLSQDLIQMRWSPNSVQSVLLCTADDPELRTVTDQFSSVEIYIRRGATGSFTLPRLPADQVKQHFRSRGAFLAPFRLTERFAIDGLLIPALDTADCRSVHEVVAGKHVTTVHSEKRAGQPAIIGMWISGEVIVAQKLLTQMGAASVDSIVLGRRDDLAVGRALRKYARYAIERIEISCPASSQKQSPPICLLWFCYEWPDKANASWRPPRRTAISRTGLVADCGGGLRVLPAPDEGGPASRSASWKAAMRAGPVSAVCRFCRGGCPGSRPRISDRSPPPGRRRCESPQQPGERAPARRAQDVAEQQHGGRT
jgi:hypothetical protein